MTFLQKNVASIHKASRYKEAGGILRYFSVSGVIVLLSACASQPLVRYEDYSQRSPSAKREKIEVVRTLPGAYSGQRTGFHIVQKGDTISSISRQYGVTFRSLLELNNLDNPELISPGQRIILRHPESTASVSGTPTRPSIIQGRTSDGVATIPLGSYETSSPDVGYIRGPKVKKEVWSQAAYQHMQSGDFSTLAPPSIEQAQDHAQQRASGSNKHFFWPAQGRHKISRKGNVTSLDIYASEGDPVMAAEGGRVVLAGGGLLGYGKMIIVRHPSGVMTVYGNNRKLLVKEGDQVMRGQKIAELGDPGAANPRLRFEVHVKGKTADPMLYLPPTP